LQEWVECGREICKKVATRKFLTAQTWGDRSILTQISCFWPIQWRTAVNFADYSDCTDCRPPAPLPVVSAKFALMLLFPTTDCCQSHGLRLGLILLLLLASLPLGSAQTLGQLLPEETPANPTEANQANKKIKLQLKTLTAETLHARLEKVLRTRLTTSQDPSGIWLGFHIRQAQGQAVTVWASTQVQQVQLSGPINLVDSWQKVIAALDTPARNSSITELIATKPGSQAKVWQAVNALQAAGSLAGDPQLAGLGKPDSTEESGRSDSVGVSLLGPVQIETVAGTEILLLRGNPRDVKRVLEVIEEIERMSKVGDPQIEVLDLQHVESRTLSTLLNQIFSDTLNNQKYAYGSLGAYPLSRPNAILLIALPATMKRAKETIAKLDRPGKEATQFEVFPLKHAKAVDAQQIVQNLFSAVETDLNSLAPSAQVLADDRTNSLIVRASPRDLEEVRALVAQIDLLGSQNINELRIFKLQNSVAEDLKNVLQEAFTNSNDPNSKLSQLLRLVTIDAEGQRKLESGVLSTAQVSSSESANALIISAPAESMPLLASLIKQLDQAPDAAIELKIFPVENGDAVSLREMLSELFRSGDGGQGTGNAAITGLRIEVDERTNSILAAGTRDDLVTVEAILRSLDSTDSRQRQNRVYRLKNKSALDVAQALNDWLRAERDVQGTAPGTASPFQQIEKEVVIVPELASNSLIVSATPRYYSEIARLINDLDAQDAMVMIQVLIAEIELGDIDEFGVELGLQDSVLFDRSLLGEIDTTTTTVISQNVGGSTTVTQDVIQAATNTPGFAFGEPANGLGNAGSSSSIATAGNLAGQVLSSFGVQRISTDAGFGGLVLSASSNSISMLLRALQESRRLEVLSRPQIMALDNQTGSAFVGQIVPFITESTPNQLTGQLINTVQRIDVGLTLEVTPRISPDGLVVMEVYVANKRLRPLSEGVPVGVAANGTPLLQPIQDAIEASTTISAVSGQTVVLSGLITKQDTALHRRVPILADIPLLGDLFRFDSVSTQRRELLIVLTPHVVRSRHDSEMLKQVESARMNWCLSDVVNIHGPAGLRSQSDRAGAAEAETVYPEQVMLEELLPLPTMAPQEMVP